MDIQNLPIGLFDSGVGGITIWKEIHKYLPNESTIYLADSKNAPYGTKSKEEIITLCKKNIDFLLKKQVKLIVIACNTATTNAVSELRNLYNIPIIGLEPAIKPASIISKTKKVGILATKGTIESEKFRNAITQYPEIKFVEQIGYNLVQMIESGKTNSKEIYNLLEKYLLPMVEKNIDCLVLGCTHYPFLIEHIQKIIPENIEILDSGSAVAKRVKSVLSDNNLLANTPWGSSTFYTNTDPNVMKTLLDNNYNIITENF